MNSDGVFKLGERPQRNLSKETVKETKGDTKRCNEKNPFVLVPPRANIATVPVPQVFASHATLRACLVCSLISTEKELADNGCPNCEEFLCMAGNPRALATFTSQNFEGLISMIDPKKSWVARYQRIVDKKPGVYAINVVGTVPRWIKQVAADEGKPYVCRNKHMRGDSAYGEESDTDGDDEDSDGGQERQTRQKKDKRSRQYRSMSRSTVQSNSSDSDECENPLPTPEKQQFTEPKEGNVSMEYPEAGDSDKLKDEGLTFPEGLLAEVKVDQVDQDQMSGDMQQKDCEYDILATPDEKLSKQRDDEIRKDVLGTVTDLVVKLENEGAQIKIRTDHFDNLFKMCLNSAGSGTFRSGKVYLESEDENSDIEMPKYRSSLP